MSYCLALCLELSILCDTFLNVDALASLVLSTERSTVLGFVNNNALLFQNMGQSFSKFVGSRLYIGVSNVERERERERVC